MTITMSGLGAMIVHTVGISDEYPLYLMYCYCPLYLMYCYRPLYLTYCYCPGYLGGTRE